MPTTEGKGLIHPTPKRVRLDAVDRWRAWNLTLKRWDYRDYGKRSDQWGRGLFGDGRKSIYVGFIGEIGWSNWLLDETGVRLPVDSAHRRLGDGGTDFRLWNWGIQVKTAASDYTDVLLKATPYAWSGWDIVVRAHWCKPHFELRGWCWRDDYQRNSDLKPSPRGAHNNFSLDAKYLKPMNDLAALILAKKTAAGGAA